MNIKTKLNLRLSTKLRLLVNDGCRWFRGERDTALDALRIIWTDLQPEIRRELLPEVRDFLLAEGIALATHAPQPSWDGISYAIEKLGTAALLRLRQSLTAIIPE
jgi:hypothetical protein